MEHRKYIFVTGGVCSSLGKGITAASIGALLKAAGYKVNMMKIDPYLNVDAGTMSPFQHGEVFVTIDGAETDLDLGNYERFLQIQTTQANSLTTGQVYKHVIDAERQGQYLGKTVQVIPHITDEIKRRIRLCDEGKNSDLVIVELGGTVGDIEGLPFLEAIRQFAVEEGRNNVKFLHLTLVPMIAGSGELKTKPTQHSVKELMSMGIQPDFLFCRADVFLPDALKSKIALFCNIDESCIFSAVNVSSTIYEVLLLFHQQGADKIILEKLGLPYKKPNLAAWEKVVHIAKNAQKVANIAMVGKYVTLEDTYKSVDAALKHGGFANECQVKIHKIDAEDYEAEIYDREKGLLYRVSAEYFHNILLPQVKDERDIAFLKSVYEKEVSKNAYILSPDLKNDDRKRVADILRSIGFAGIIPPLIDGILIPGGFGNRGVEGKIKALYYGRTNKVPTFGICLGMQCMVIEFARNECGLTEAHSTEFAPSTTQPVIDLLDNLKGVKYMGGTMRRGGSKCILSPKTKIASIYNRSVIVERHRHRYEVNPEYVPLLQEKGLVISGQAENGLVETVELSDHPWFIGTQFHPEFQSSPLEPHPLFVSFIKAALDYQARKEKV